MSQPPVDPASRDLSADASPTEPVPAFEPAPPAAPSTGPVSPELAFAPVEPEPGPGQASAVPPAPASSGGRSGPGSSKPILVAMGAIVVVGVAAVAFAAGRTIVPASDATGGVANRQELQGGGQRDGRQGQGQGRDDNAQGGQGQGGQGQGGQGPMGGGLLPDANLAPDGNDRLPGGHVDGGVNGNGAFPGSGLGRQGMRGLDLTGTVTAVTPDSLTIQTEAGATVTIGLDDGTTYHQQAPAASSDVTTGTKIQVQLDGGVRPSRDANGNINLGTADDITVVT
jgi:hypothetical protein